MVPLFDRLFRAVTAPDAGLAGLATEQALLLMLGALLQPRRGPPAVPAGIASARAMIDDDPLAAPTLAQLAGEAGLSRFQFLRGFARATGLTPHAYLVQRRIHRARRLIGSGVRLADAAAACGFADQSHMTRLFVRSFGMAPGSYAKALD